MPRSHQAVRFVVAIALIWGLFCSYMVLADEHDSSVSEPVSVNYSYR